MLPQKLKVKIFVCTDIPYFFLYNKINGNDDYDDDDDGNDDDDDGSVIFEQTFFFSSLVFGAFLLLSDQTQLKPDNSSFNPRLLMTVWERNLYGGIRALA